MTKQLEVIYEGGVLRPLEPLPFAEKERLTVTVSNRPAPVKHVPFNPRTREFEWIRMHGSEHAGKYVAIEGDQLVGEGDSVSAVMEQAGAKGFPLPLVHYIPKEPHLPFAGW
jgi:predicted DNA-binding antitoxin AbrB/MazE fold protein